MTNEEIARNTASQWCRCFKCDGIIRDTRNKCNKDTMITCHQWYHGYRAAKLACGEKDQQFKEYLEKKIKTINSANYDSCWELLNEIINELLGEEYDLQDSIRDGSREQQ